MPKETKNYKDTVFSSLFYECKDATDNAKNLYKALTGKEVEEIEKCRLEEVLFREFKNDVAYIMDGKWVCFIEHQSTINPNMPLRLFVYAARTYERFITGDMIYSGNLVKVPKPEFYVLYNGKTKLNDDNLKFSTAFYDNTGDTTAEINVKVLDIDYGRMNTQLKNCRTLSGYAFLVDSVRKNNGNIEKAVKECVDNNVLKEYLTFYGSEVINMLFEEYNAEKALEIRGKEEYEKGKADGEITGEEKGTAKMIQRYYQWEKNIKKISDIFKMPETEVSVGKEYQKNFGYFQNARNGSYKISCHECKRIKISDKS